MLQSELTFRPIIYNKLKRFDFKKYIKNGIHGKKIPMLFNSNKIMHFLRIFSLKKGPNKMLEPFGILEWIYNLTIWNLSMYCESIKFTVLVQLII